MVIAAKDVMDIMVDLLYLYCVFETGTDRHLKLKRIVRSLSQRIDSTK